MITNMENLKDNLEQYIKIKSKLINSMAKSPWTIELIDMLLNRHEKIGKDFARK